MGIRLPIITGIGCCAAVAGVIAGQSGFAAQSPAPPKVTQIDPEQLAEVGAGSGSSTPQSGMGAPVGRSAGGTAPVTTVGAITGAVTGTGNRAVAGYLVEAFTADGNFIADTTTDSGGKFTLAGLQAGSYKVRFSGPASGAAPWAMAWAGGSADMTKASVLVVGTSALKSNITLSAAATVTGKVAGVPAGSEVRVCGATFLDCRTSFTAANGRFAINGLAAGVDSIVVHPVGGVDLAFPKQPPREGLTLRANQTTDVTLDAATQAAPVVAIGGKVIKPTSPPSAPDRTGPKVTAAKLTTEKSKRYVTVTATDGQGGSGLAKIQVRVGTKEFAPSPYTTDGVAAPGTGEVVVRVQDKAGNYSGWVVAK